MKENNNNEVIELSKIKEEKDALDNTIILKRPIEYGGDYYDKLVLDFEKLTGEDIENAEMQFNAEDPKNSIVMVKEMAKGFVAIVAANAAGVKPNVIRQLSASDYSKVTMRTTVFLMSGE